MICDNCAKAADENKLGLANHLCKGQTWCDCQHSEISALSTGTKEYSHGTRSGIQEN